MVCSRNASSCNGCREQKAHFYAKSGKRISGNPQSVSREIGKTDFGIKKQENTTENTYKKNDDDDQSKLHAQLPTKHPVVVVVSSWPGDDDEPTEIVEKLTEKLKLSYDQSGTVQFYLDQVGKGYVLEKVRITRSKDLRNAGGFLSALWKRLPGAAHKHKAAAFC